MARAPRMVFRGNDRGRLRKLQKAIDQILAMDSREQVKAAALEYDPVLFVGSSTQNSALQRTLDRINLCLSLKR